MELHIVIEQSKEVGKNQELIQSSTTHDLGHGMGRLQKHKKTSHTREPRDQPFPTRSQETDMTGKTCYILLSDNSTQ